MHAQSGHAHHPNYMISMRADKFVLTGPDKLRASRMRAAVALTVRLVLVQRFVFGRPRGFLTSGARIMSASLPVMWIEG